MRSILFACALSLPLAALAEVKVVEPWIPEAPPTAHAMAAFMVLENDEDRPVRVVAAHAPGFDTIELHKSVEENGMHKMLRQDALVIPEMGSLELRPGGYHVMLIGVHEPRPKAGDIIPMRLDLEGGKSIELKVPVKRRADMMQRMQNMQGH
ncbi:MAG: copper chaperone PCu(A)C [Halothiobacillaceae bacterium]